MKNDLKNQVENNVVDKNEKKQVKLSFICVMQKDLYFSKN